MTIYAYEAQETWLPTVTGLTCSAVEIQGDTLRLHFGTTRTAPDDVLEAQRTISMHGVWRIERGEEIAAGSGDEQQGDVTLLIGAALERFEVGQPGFDLDLYFSSRITARSFPCDSSEFAEDMDDEDDVPISWWVDGDGVSDDWEEPYDPPGV